MARALCLLGGQILLIGRFAKILPPAEEIHLERRHADPGLVYPGYGVAAVAELGRVLLDRALRPDTDSGPTVASSNTVLGTRRFHAFDRYTHVAIVLKGKPDPLSEFRVPKKLFPATVAGRIHLEGTITAGGFPPP